MDALKYYKGYKGDTEEEENALKREHERLRSIAREQQKDQSLHISDFSECFKHSVVFKLGEIVDSRKFG